MMNQKESLRSSNEKELSHDFNKSLGPIASLNIFLKAINYIF